MINEVVAFWNYPIPLYWGIITGLFGYFWAYLHYGLYSKRKVKT